MQTQSRQEVMLQEVDFGARRVLQTRLQRFFYLQEVDFLREVVLKR